MGESTQQRMVSLCNQFSEEAEGRQSKAQQTRMRKISLELGKVGKDFRKDSVEAGKK